MSTVITQQNSMILNIQSCRINSASNADDSLYFSDDQKLLIFLSANVWSIPRTFILLNIINSKWIVWRYQELLLAPELYLKCELLAGWNLLQLSDLWCLTTPLQLYLAIWPDRHQLTCQQIPNITTEIVSNLLLILFNCSQKFKTNPFIEKFIYYWAFRI